MPTVNFEHKQKWLQGNMIIFLRAQ